MEKLDVLKSGLPRATQSDWRGIGNLIQDCDAGGGSVALNKWAVSHGNLQLRRILP
jgi:hypothetical protein